VSRGENYKTGEEDFGQNILWTSWLRTTDAAVDPETVVAMASLGKGTGEDWVGAVCANTALSGTTMAESMEGAKILVVDAKAGVGMPTSITGEFTGGIGVAVGGEPSVILGNTTVTSSRVRGLGVSCSTAALASRQMTSLRAKKRM